MVTLYWYPKCSTCKNAKRWLEEREIAVETVDMIQNIPSKQQLLAWLEESKFSYRRFFNTSGMKYRELGLKDQIADYSFDEAAAILSTDGMLIKRPLLVSDGEILAIGFKENEYEGVFNESWKKDV